MGVGGGICGQLVWREQVCGASSSPPSGAIASCRVVRSREADQPTLTHWRQGPTSCCPPSWDTSPKPFPYLPLHPCLSSQGGQQSGLSGQISLIYPMVSSLALAVNSIGTSRTHHNKTFQLIASIEWMMPCPQMISDSLTLPCALPPPTSWHLC